MLLMILGGLIATAIHLAIKKALATFTSPTRQLKRKLKRLRGKTPSEAELKEIRKQVTELESLAFWKDIPCDELYEPMIKLFHDDEF